MNQEQALSIIIQVKEEWVSSGKNHELLRQAIEVFSNLIEASKNTPSKE